MSSLPFFSSLLLLSFLFVPPLLLAQPSPPNQPSPPSHSPPPPPPPNHLSSSSNSPPPSNPSSPPSNHLSSPPSSSNPPPPPSNHPSPPSNRPNPPPPPSNHPSPPSNSPRPPPSPNHTSPPSNSPPPPSPNQPSPSSNSPPPPSPNNPSPPSNSPPPSPNHTSPSPPNSPPPPPTSSSEACKSTIYPKLCRSILSAIRSSPSDPYSQGKFSIKQSLKQAKKLAKVFHDFVKKHTSSTSLKRDEIAALIDCRDLNQLNVDYLASVWSQLKTVEASSPELVVGIETYLSAVATNHYTCYDGLVMAKSGIANALEVPLKGVTQLYSVSLGLVVDALNRNLKKHKVGKHGLPANGNKVRQPLQKLIKLLREKYGCKKSSECTRNERILRESEEDGILLNEFVTVSLDGTANFTSIGNAIAAAPNNTNPQDGYFLIYAKEGYYEEYVVVPQEKRNVLLIGDGINRTVITGNHNVVDGWTTFNSSTFAVSGDRFMAVDVTFRNTAGPEKHQAVAVRNNADLSTFYRCSFEGYQDTLYVHSLRQFYRDCDIYGTVDFIFGNAAVVLQSCNIYVRKPLPQQKNAVTAQGRTDPNQNTGISIQNCTVLPAPDFAITNNSDPTYLGRPWKEYSRTVVMESYIGDLVQPSGWLEWNGTVGLDTLFYGEFDNYGPRSDTKNRVQWRGYSLLSAEQAINFTVSRFTLGETWIPATDIPFDAGLLG